MSLLVPNSRVGLEHQVRSAVVSFREPAILGHRLKRRAGICWRPTNVEDRAMANPNQGGQQSQIRNLAKAAR
jgi:hypothetical protein